MSADNELDVGRQLAGLSLLDLWYAYIALGGSSPISALQSQINDASVLSAYEHDLIAHAINERFTDLGGDHPIPYRRVT